MWYNISTKNKWRLCYDYVRGVFQSGIGGRQRALNNLFQAHGYAHGGCLCRRDVPQAQARMDEGYPRGKNCRYADPLY